jgi:hypothetical protein
MRGLQRHAWTEADDRRLQTLAEQGSSLNRAAAALNRTTISVRSRAGKLGCKFPSLRIARKKVESSEWRSWGRRASFARTT